MVSDDSLLKDNKEEDKGLNPCCNGIWSQTITQVFSEGNICLNPCCNGIWSQTWADYGC